ncbi:MAG: non-ribosomal peptide synthetase, partial [bacterium]|nr:non-ribosomal peptide synthetase [bacterium]
KAAMLAAKIHKETEVKIPLVEIFKTPTPAGLIAYIKAAARQEFIAVLPVEEKEYYPLSPAQKRIYILQNIEPGNQVYNMPARFKLEGKLQKERLEKTFKQLIKRHESLRTSFHMTTGTPMQKIHPHVEFDIPYYRGDENAQIETEFFRTFNLEKAPLLRAGVMEIDEEHRHLLVDMHHIISDGTTMGVIIGEFMALYKGDDIPAPAVRYRDYAAWQNREPEKKERQENYWMETFAGDIPVLELWSDYDRPLQLDFQGNRTGFEIGRESAEGLNKLAAGHNATLYMVLLAVYNVWLAKLTGDEDIVVGTVVAGREHQDLERVVGMFVNTLALRNK